MARPIEDEKRRLKRLILELIRIRDEKRTLPEQFDESDLALQDLSPSDFILQLTENIEKRDLRDLLDAPDLADDQAFAQVLDGDPHMESAVRQLVERLFSPAVGRPRTLPEHIEYQMSFWERQFQSHADELEAIDGLAERSKRASMCAAAMATFAVCAGLAAAEREKVIAKKYKELLLYRQKSHGPPLSASGKAERFIAFLYESTAESVAATRSRARRKRKDS